MAIRSVISTLNHDGTEVMGPGILMYHYPGNDIMNGSWMSCFSSTGPWSASPTRWPWL
jgi:hypothetical protein